MANIAEGFGRRNDKECIQFMFLAKASGAVQSHLFVALDRGYLDKQEFDSVFGMADEVARQLSGFISYLTGAGKTRQS